MNPELLLNHTISTPIYISPTTMVVPAENLLLNSFNEIVVEFASFAWQTLAIFSQTIAFITRETFVAVNENLSFTEKIIIIFCLYNFIAIAVSEIGSMSKQQELQEKLERTEKQLNYLKKSEKLRENCDLMFQMWTEEIKNMYNEQNKKINNIEKITSVLNEQTDNTDHHRNEQIIFKKISQLNKELIKIKKEIGKYA